LTDTTVNDQNIFVNGGDNEVHDRSAKCILPRGKGDEENS